MNVTRNKTKIVFAVYCYQKKLNHSRNVERFVTYMLWHLGLQSSPHIIFKIMRQNHQQWLRQDGRSVFSELAKKTKTNVFPMHITDRQLFTEVPVKLTTAISLYIYTMGHKKW